MNKFLILFSSGKFLLRTLSAHDSQWKAEARRRGLHAFSTHVSVRQSKHQVWKRVILELCWKLSGYFLLKTHDMPLNTFTLTSVSYVFKRISSQYTSFVVVGNLTPLLSVSQYVNVPPAATQRTPQQLTCILTTRGSEPLTSWLTTPSWKNPQTS